MRWVRDALRSFSREKNRADAPCRDKLKLCFLGPIPQIHKTPSPQGGNAFVTRDCGASLPAGQITVNSSR